MSNYLLLQPYIYLGLKKNFQNIFNLQSIKNILEIYCNSYLKLILNKLVPPATVPISHLIP